MEKFRFRWDDLEDKVWYDHLTDVVRGSVRAFTKGFAGRAAFSIRTGTSLCGIRGT